MIFARFYALSPVTHELIEAAGDRSYLRLDGRVGRAVWHETAEQTAHLRGYIGYMLYKGDSILTATPVSKLMLVKQRSGRPEHNNTTETKYV